MKDKLREIGIRLTELADYFNLSRPTIYKYIDLYEKKKYEQINPMIRNVFVFIDSKEIISKKEVITYIINLLNKELVFTDHDAVLKTVYDKMRTSASMDTLYFILNWLDHPEYLKFMESFNRYHNLIANKTKITNEILENDFNGLNVIYHLENQ